MSHMNSVTKCHYIPGASNHLFEPSETIAIEPYTKNDASHDLTVHLMGLYYELETAKQRAKTALPAENRKWWAIYRDQIKSDLKRQLGLFVRPPQTVSQAGFGDEPTKVTELNEVSRAA